MNNLIQVVNNENVTTSLIVAEKFNKNHKNVIRKIEALISQIEIGSILSTSLLFVKSEYLDSYDRPQAMYYINRDGFTLLAMGFTGAEALEWKLKYIRAFNEMEARLRGGREPVIDNREIIARLLLQASDNQLPVIKQLYPEYFSPSAPGSSFELLVDKNTSYTQWIQDYEITAEWVSEFPTLDIYNNYVRYCVERRYMYMGKKHFYATLALDFGLERKQKADGHRYLIRG